MTVIRPFGAVPPQMHNWQIGKTPASIRFVQLSEQYLENGDDDEKAFALREAIADIKSGKLVFDEPTTPEQFLERS